MRRRSIFKSGLAFTLCGVLGFLAAGDKPNQRRQYRNSTEGSVKWKQGHNAGCVLYAPDNECICDEFKDTSRYYGAPTVEISSLDKDLKWTVRGNALK